jgi:RNA polymerase primary sigma factor
MARKKKIAKIARKKKAAKKRAAGAKKSAKPKCADKAEKKPGRAKKPLEAEEVREEGLPEDEEESREHEKSKSAIVRKLIRAGKDKGYLSYDEVNEILPDDVVSSDEIDEVITALHSADIKVVESEEEVERIPLAVKSAQKKVKARKFVQIDDPVKMYLKQMGQIPLLSRSEELELAKRIKKKEKDFKEIVFTIKMGREMMLDSIEEAFDNEYNLDDVLDIQPGADLNRLEDTKRQLIKRINLSKKEDTVIKLMRKLKVAILLVEKVGEEISKPMEEAKRLSGKVDKLRKGRA